jgi:hypothetical protein
MGFSVVERDGPPPTLAGAPDRIASACRRMLTRYSRMPISARRSSRPPLAGVMGGRTPPCIKPSRASAALSGAGLGSAAAGPARPESAGAQALRARLQGRRMHPGQPRDHGHGAARRIENRGEHRVLLRLVERRRFAGGAERNEARHLRVPKALDQPLQRGVIDRSAAAERRHQWHPNP